MHNGVCIQQACTVISGCTSNISTNFLARVHNTEKADQVHYYSYQQDKPLYLIWVIYQMAFSLGFQSVIMVTEFMHKYTILNIQYTFNT